MAILGSIGSKLYLAAGAGSLYVFTTHTFTNAGVTGSTGPNLSQVRSAYSSTSWASTYLNMDVNGIQLWTVPATGVYSFDVRGAQGGQSTNWGPLGGLGARMTGRFTLTRGQVLKILVGQKGGDNTYDGGGGGGSFVTTATNTPLIIAGGGGGGSASGFSGSGTFGGGTGPNGSSTSWASGGTNGNGGGGSTAGGGGGLIGNGGGSWGGQSFVNGGVGGSNAFGGFGGGGGGGGTNGAGGGGGYSGGAYAPWSYYGAGGGSYNDGTSPSNTAEFQSGMGQVIVTRIS